MSTATVAGARRPSLSRVATATSYVALGLLLLWSRLYDLGASGYCCDEGLTVEAYVRGGPSEILAGAYVPNNHQLFSMLGWATSSVLGESEALLRLGSAIPFVVGVALVTAWLHTRLGALPGVLFLFLATLSPLLLDLSRQARGYGLAFLAMSLVVVGALELLRSQRTWPLVAFATAGVVGVWTLPHFAIAFVAVVLALIVLDVRRAHVAAALVANVAAWAAWYAPHLDDVLRSSAQEYAVALETRWILTAPLDQTLVPAFSLLSDDYLHPNLASLAFVGLFVLVIAASPLVRERASASVLVTPVVATIAVFWLTGTHAAPRFFSFLLVPLFVLLATGAAVGLTRLRQLKPSVAGLAAVTMLVVVGAGSARLVADIPRQPREALPEVAEAIKELEPPAIPVFAYVYHPGDLESHLGRRVAQTRTAADLQEACSQAVQVVVVRQIWLLPPVEVPCADAPGVRHTRFEQYARGEAIDMWVVPPRSGS